MVCYTVSCEFMLCASRIFIRRIFSHVSNSFQAAHLVGRQGPAGLCRVRTGAGGAGPCRPRQCRIFPAGEPVVQPGPVRAGAGGAAAGGREVRPVPLGCDHRLLGRGAALLLLGRDPPQLRVHLGLRQLHQQAVQRRGRLCPDPHDRLPLYLRLPGRGLHQLHHPVHRVPVLPDRPHRRQLCDLSGVQHRAHAAAFAGRSGGQSGPDAAGEKPLLVFSHRSVLDLYLPVATHECRAEPAGLVRPDLRLQHPAAHAGFPV